VTACTRVLVVVPALDEAATVGTVVRGLRAAGFDCLVVDDGSTDATAALARAAGARVVRMPFNLGVGGALRCGFRFAVDHGYDAVVQCDADGQHPPAEVLELVRAQQASHAHLVVGSRFLDGSRRYPISLHRRFMMRCLGALVRLTTGLRVRDTTSGFRCIAEPLLTEFAASYPVHYLGDTFEAIVVAGRAGYTILEVPIAMEERSTGTSSARPLAAMTFLARAFLAICLGLGFRIRPYRPPVETTAQEPVESRR
jgi:glycosyltransferase involved in cell wall biosynthesis